MACTLHVFDEARSESRDFNCKTDTLLSAMKYFRGYLKDVQPQQNVRISVHCDVQIFEWLLQFAQATRDGSSAPQVNITSVVPILISSNFLGMDDLVSLCISFVAHRLPAVAQASSDLAALPTDLLQRLAKETNEAQLEQLYASSCGPASDAHAANAAAHSALEQLVGRLYKHRIEHLLRELRTTVVRCKCCGAMFSLAEQAKLNCSAKEAPGAWGAGKTRPQVHEPDPSWRLQDHLSALRAVPADGSQGAQASWRDIYWDVWSVVHVLYCGHCMTHFPAQELSMCCYHPDAPIYLGGKSSGRYPCCGGHALRSGTVQLFNGGCCMRDHEVLVGPEQAGGRGAAVLSILQAFRSLVVPETCGAAVGLGYQLEADVGVDEDSEDSDDGVKERQEVGAGRKLSPSRPSSSFAQAQHTQRHPSSASLARQVYGSSRPRPSTASGGSAGASGLAAKRGGATSEAVRKAVSPGRPHTPQESEAVCAAADVVRSRQESGSQPASWDAVSGSLVCAPPRAHQAPASDAALEQAGKLGLLRESVQQQAGAGRDVEPGGLKSARSLDQASSPLAHSCFSASAYIAAAGDAGGEVLRNNDSPGGKGPAAGYVAQRSAHSMPTSGSSRWMPGMLLSGSGSPRAAADAAAGSGHLSSQAHIGLVSSISVEHASFRAGLSSGRLAGVPPVKVVPLSSLEGAGTLGNSAPTQMGSQTARKLRLELLHEDDMARMDVLISHLVACRPTPSRMVAGGVGLGATGGPAQRVGNAALGRPDSAGPAGYVGVAGSRSISIARGAKGEATALGRATCAQRPMSAPRMRPPLAPAATSSIYSQSFMYAAPAGNTRT